MEAKELVQKQREFFMTGKTKSLAFRREALKHLYLAIKANEDKLFAALKFDLNKSEQEAYMTELSLVYDEIKYMYRNLGTWAAPKKVRPSLAQLPAICETRREPYGVVLIMAPWNYPFLLSIEPLIGALAAGNCVVVKPSNYAPATSAVIAEIIQKVFAKKYVAVVEGGREQNQSLLEQKFDYIFFTGGAAVGRVVMGAAARHLTPVSLELGGKSPCIVEETANLSVAAKRIVFGKLVNAGQTCVAPDYLLVQENVKDALLALIKKELVQALGSEPLQNEEYPRIVNEKHFLRLAGLIEGENCYCGGELDAENLKIAPTVLTDVTGESACMQEEIFGPILPVLTYDSIEDAIAFVQKREKPLACYLFTGDKEIEELVLNELSFGGGCINDTILHLATSHMGFGGVGESGMGSYHGEKSFATFSHEKSIMKKIGTFEPNLRFHPYTEQKMQLIRKIFH